MTDRTELRRLLERATPGPWHACDRARKRDWQFNSAIRSDDRRLCRECRIKAGWTVEW